MTSSPLARRREAAPMYDPVQALHDHCDKLNKLNWVADSGFPYFVNRRERADGTDEHFVDRKIV